ncbi:MAG: ArsR family transcriptional regulator [Methanocalculus sp. MSAO_Arc1]|uniref:MarR family transcriptional regulator n=1 Tax=Methanocalculus TaxID=71151 RepID=UPI000FF23C15|nr:MULTISPECIES: MarR family transcriptional regulator [unclassified Methanocalculus]MCP1662534.1 putative transcriptional regulator [Methanocalculus sp. AMF5]RQD80095.1 MAG: ArsR family transcriptional regulator [Methanocalculus sp. MSAO_Arc1]
METGAFGTLTPKQEEIVTLLNGVGMKRNVAKVLVYLSELPEATSREIERATDLRQPEVSIAMRELKEQEWVNCRESKTENKGRPVKIYSISLGLNDITNILEQKKRQEAETQISMINRMRECIES